VAPRLQVEPDDAKADEAWFKTLAAWCERFTPWVAVDRSHDRFRGKALWLDTTSSAHLFGGEAGLLADLLSQLGQQGATARAAIADHPGTAWAACRFGDEEQRILPTDGARVVLAPLPVEALRLDTDQRAALMKSGIDRIEHLYLLPRRALNSRFGDRLVTRLDQALGLIDEPIGPHAPLPAQQARLIFAEPVIDGNVLLQATEQLLRQLCISLEAVGLGARRLILALYRVDNSAVTFSVSTDRPSRDFKRLKDGFAEKMAGVDLGFGIERAILDATAIEPLLPETIVWRGLGTQTAAVVRDLARSGKSPDDGQHHTVAFFRPKDTHGVEHMPRRFSGSIREATALKLEPPSIDPLAIQETLPRPLRLLRWPEPIEAIAPSPDEPPILFRWRECLHKIVSARGPKRVAPDWWRIPESEKLSPHKGDSQPMRDYFAVENSDGERFWLFREGHFQKGQTREDQGRRSPTVLPRWYLHGLFA
ncbi:MAG: Y-family DNA polymerase, partial [Geminicoccaceae bacterium]